MDRRRIRTWNTGSYWQTTGFSGYATVYQGGLLGREQTVDAQHSRMKAVYLLQRVLSDPKTPTRQRARIERQLDVIRRQFDTGNAFSNDKSSVTGTFGEWSVANVGYQKRFLRGHILPQSVGNLPAYLTPTDTASLFAKGGDAIRRVAPTNPHASLLVALGEIYHEGLPKPPVLMAWKNHCKEGLPKTASGEYLNVEFGWKPLISDIAKAYRSYEQADALWQRQLRNSGKPMRRKYAFDPIQSTTVTNLGSSYGWPIGVSQLYKAPGNLTKTVTSTTKLWFSGCFRYHIPEASEKGGAIRQEMARLRLLYGLSLDPYTLWNLMPWSWLADWVVDFGGLVKSLSLLSNDGLVMQYGYLMEHKIVETVYSLQGPTLVNGSCSSSTLAYVQESKRRVRATPFGFGLTWEGFTPRQLAILAAIGITRLA